MIQYVKQAGLWGPSSIDLRLAGMKLLVLEALSPLIRDKTLELVCQNRGLEDEILGTSDDFFHHMFHTVQEACLQLLQ